MVSTKNRYNFLLQISFSFEPQNLKLSSSSLRSLAKLEDSVAANVATLAKFLGKFDATFFPARAARYK